MQSGLGFRAAVRALAFCRPQHGGACLIQSSIYFLGGRLGRCYSYQSLDQTFLMFPFTGMRLAIEKPHGLDGYRMCLSRPEREFWRTLTCLPNACSRFLKRGGVFAAKDVPCFFVACPRCACILSIGVLRLYVPFPEKAVKGLRCFPRLGPRIA